MKKWIKVVCCVLPVMILTLSFVFLSTYNNKSNNTETKTINAAEQEPTASSSTGASSAPKNEKGGAIFLEENTSYTMSGGTIQGKSKKYGGAVYISNNATFTMNGGTITGCQAKYGGAIYVAAGGHCIIKGGTITGNSAVVAPAIYVEDGGILTTETGSKINGNEQGIWFEIAGNELFGGGEFQGTLSNVSLDYVYFGNYPQTYVGDSMNSTLEDWYGGRPVEKTYTIRDCIWNAYRYTDGELYVRGQSNPSSADDRCTYKDGTRIKSSGTICWFKVEPIKWFVLNKSGNDYELFSELVLTGNVYFNSTTSGEGVNLWENSYIRKWCNSEFLNTAFSNGEKKHIRATTVGNNVTDNYSSSTSDQTGAPTQDYIYFKSYYEVGIRPFCTGIYYPDYPDADVVKGSRISSASDFAFSNYTLYSVNKRYLSFYRGLGGNTLYWLRSAGTSDTVVYCINNYGTRKTTCYTVTNLSIGVRPALHVVV